MKFRAFNLGLLLITFMIPVYAQQVVVGKIGFAKGSNAAQQPNTAPRLLGKNAEVYQGDNIQTSDDSFVIIEFTDGSKVTVRPNSNFKIEQFDNASKNAKFTVYEGGVRASTGEFSKAGSDNFQIKTPTATLKGEKDSDFSVRVCKEDCDNKEKKAEPSKDTSVAKVVDIKGEVFAKNRADKTADERKLAIGGGLNPQDYLTSQSNSYLVMVFRDGEKVTLQPNSELDIVKYDFQQPNKKDQMLFKLAAGGMRALTGSIGKKDHSAYALDTPVATIGIRGTESETVIDDSVDVATGHAPVYNHVTEGSISVRNGAGETVLNQGESSITSSPNTPTIQVPTLPTKVTNQLTNTPSPKTAPDPDKAFDKPAANSKSGTYATVNKGSAKLESNKGDDKGAPDKNSPSAANDKGGNDKSNAPPPPSSNDDSGSGKGKPGSPITLAAGESSFSGESGGAAKLDAPPAFISHDDAPPPSGFNNNAPPPMFSPLNNMSTKDSGAACVVE